MKRVAVLIAGVALVLLTGTGVTLALWSDAETIEGATVTSGTLTLSIGGQSQVVIGPLTGLYPGGVVATKVSLDGQASGNLGLDYTLTSALSDQASASSALFGVLDAQLHAQTGSSGSCAATGTPSGTQIYPADGGFGDLATLSATGTLVTAEQDTATTYICARFTIPAGTPSTIDGIELSGAQTSFVLDIAGEGTR